MKFLFEFSINLSIWFDLIKIKINFRRFLFWKGAWIHLIDLPGESGFYSSRSLSCWRYFYFRLWYWIFMPLIRIFILNLPHFRNHVFWPIHHLYIMKMENTLLLVVFIKSSEYFILFLHEILQLYKLDVRFWFSGIY